MKRYLCILLCILLTGIFLCGCDTTYQKESGSDTCEEDFAGGYFTAITKWKDDGVVYQIIYANDTKVKYLATRGLQRQNQAITPLYNADGTLQIYDDNEPTIDIQKDVK